MTTDELVSLKSRSNLKDIVERVVKLTGTGDNLRGLCPFHPERTPSFHVHPERGFYKCFGCGAGGDVIDFVRGTEGLTFAAAVEALAVRAGLPPPATPLERDPRRSIPTLSIEVREPSKSWLRLQSVMHPGTITELSSLATLRHLPSLAPLELATRHGQLFFGPVYDDGFDWPAWILTDGSRRNAQARRLDGQPWSGIGNKKAKTIAGSEAKWPVGIHEAAPGLDIALVEGAPDFLAAWHFIWANEAVSRVRPVAMFGAANPIHAEALPLFAHRRVFTFPHADTAGAKAGAKWADQLRAVHCGIVPWEMEDGLKDLNDLVAAQEGDV